MSEDTVKNIKHISITFIKTNNYHKSYNNNNTNKVLLLLL